MFHSHRNKYLQIRQTHHENFGGDGGMLTADLSQGVQEWTQHTLGSLVR